MYLSFYACYFFAFEQHTTLTKTFLLIIVIICFLLLVKCFYYIVFECVFQYDNPLFQI